jgi:hypothetical protein
MGFSQAWVLVLQGDGTCDNIINRIRIKATANAGQGAVKG